MAKVCALVLLVLATAGIVAGSPCPQDCSGHGFCLKQGVCRCSESWTGHNCAIAKCPMGVAWSDFAVANDNAHNLAVCSNRGKCDTTTGVCTCLSGFTGQACDRLACACNGRGTCVSMKDYALTKDRGLGQPFPYDTNWDATKLYGCMCDAPYSGYSCQISECPRGDDPLTGTIYDPTGLQYNEKQIVNCKATGGAFTLTFRGHTTVPIAPSDSAATVQAKVGALPSVNGVAVSYSGITTQACTILGNNIALEFTQDFGDLPSVVGDASQLTHSSAGMIPTLTITTAVDGTKENAFCSNRGLCDRTSGICACFMSFFSSDGNGNIGTRGDCGYAFSAITQCPGSVLACSGHGICQGPPTYTCICASGFQGGDCSERICPVGKAWFDMPFDAQGAHALAECSNAGTCDRSKGECVCDPRFTGASCNRMVCPNECSGHGTCQTIQSMAGLSVINGDPVKLTYGAIPNNYPTWDFDQLQGCVCNPGYTDFDCSKFTCPTGDDPVTRMDTKNRPQANTIQVVQCIGTTGTFTLGFRGQTTPALSFSISAASLTVALQALPAFGQVSVVYSSGPAACTASGINSISITFRTVFGTLPTIRTTVNGVTSVTVKNDGTGGSVVGTKEDAVCSNRGTCDTLHGICICAEGFTSSDGYGGPGSRGDCGYMEPVYLNSAAKVANEIA
ncbi:hypothetical protein H257_11334 [Aphanomyces astaci]|uniref:EGF-like domain-containing protein n=2 Tax=Aphanomyces astaci TaxID=112090 RepID=W4G505_APHAT|nr:hypothetical protein H257_11334 [Aphanomyces astaci]ETV74018.1 hypothetical protein H257_11334 [Aphanomyces astaci]|eukprot:XP_009836531.1 hypothetical protein H257_11334 [Aphanomyces astaci]